MNILIVSAHPDDEIIGMGGTLKKLSKKNNVNVLFLADGITARKQSGFTNSNEYDVTEKQKKIMNIEIEKRKIHARDALKFLGIKNLKFLDLPDNELDLVPFLKIVKEIEKEIIKTKCDTIFTHHYNDLNIDHRFAYEASITAARPLKNSHIKSVISFEAISSSDWRQPYSFKPNLFIDISKELPQKIKALEAYKNEIQKFPHPRSKEALKSSAKRWGSLYGYNAAEAFEIVYTRSQNFPFV
jgi:LmbE family N-acetylglucosaminyl deacetylase